MTVMWDDGFIYFPAEYSNTYSQPSTTKTHIMAQELKSRKPASELLADSVPFKTARSITHFFGISKTRHRLQTAAPKGLAANSHPKDRSSHLLHRRDYLCSAGR